MYGKERLRDAMNIAKFMARFGYFFGEEIAKKTVLPWSERLFAQPEDTSKAASAVHAALVGIRTVEYGRRQGESEVELMGGAMAVRAAVRAEEEADIPEETVEAIVMDIVEARIDPALNPLIGDDDARTIDGLVYREDNLAPDTDSET